VYPTRRCTGTPLPAASTSAQRRRLTLRQDTRRHAWAASHHRAPNCIAKGLIRTAVACLRLRPNHRMRPLQHALTQGVHQTQNWIPKLDDLTGRITVSVRHQRLLASAGHGLQRRTDSRICPWIFNLVIPRTKSFSAPAAGRFVKLPVRRLQAYTSIGIDHPNPVTMRYILSPIPLVRLPLPNVNTS